MGRVASPTTELRHLKKRFKEHDDALRETRIQMQGYRERASRAEAEVSEWKKRFDVLLKRDNPLQVVGPSLLDPDQCMFCHGRHGSNMPCPKLAPICSTNQSEGVK